MGVGGMAGGRGEGIPALVADGVQLQIGGGQAAQVAGGMPVTLVSLDVDLPSTAGYREVLFKTPRGEVEITARPLATEISRRLGRVGWVAGGLLVAGAIYLAVRRFGAAILASRSAALLIFLLGLLSVITFVLPIAGLLLAITGLVLLVGSLFSKRRLAM
jgi:hypothetical protein